MAATARQCSITLLPNNVEMCFWCLHDRFLTPGKLIQSRDNIYYQYFTKLWGETNFALGKRHIVVQCNNNDLFNKVIFTHLEAEGNKRNIRHVVNMFRLLTNNIL